MADRQTYAIEKDIVDRDEAGSVCAMVIEVLRPVLHLALVDAVSDYPDRMPDAVRRAETVLREVGARQDARGRDAVMAIEVAATDPEWEAVEAYAAWSINVDLIGAEDIRLGTLHDCGVSITADLTDSEAAELRARLPQVPLVLLAELKQARINERNARRRRWLTRWFSTGPVEDQ